MSVEEIDPLKKNPLEHEGTTIVSNVIEGKNSNKKAYIESYGCQMNFADSEVVASILHKEGYSITDTLDQASLVLVNTCSIREKAELTVRKRLEYFNSLKRNGFHIVYIDPNWLYISWSKEDRGKVEKKPVKAKKEKNYKLIDEYKPTGQFVNDSDLSSIKMKSKQLF